MYRLLIAEDEMIERSVLKKVLLDHLGDQCEIFEAENGKEAIQVSQKEKTQIAILDIGMPGLTGIQAAEIIRKENPDCVIIFLTAYDRFDYAKKAISVRALEYLLKPYSEKELLTVVGEAMCLVDSSKSESEVPESAEAEGEMGKQVSIEDMIEEYIQKHYMEDCSMQDIAKYMNYSEAYFCKIFKQHFGQNFTSYLTEYRIEEAKKLLCQPNINVKEIGEQVGYADSNYFAKVFRRMVGCSPSEYRSQLGTA